MSDMYLIVFGGLSLFTCAAIILACIICCLCRPWYGSCTPLPPQETQQIISSMQGDWDVTLKRVTLETPFDLVSVRVRGTTVSGMYRNGSGYDTPLFTLRPAKLESGTIILDRRGVKVDVFSLERGYLETSFKGKTFEWKKEEMTQGAGGGECYGSTRPHESTGSHSVSATAQPRPLTSQPRPLTVQPPPLPHLTPTLAATVWDKLEIRASTSRNPVDDLAMLNQLWEQGGLTEEEFSAAKFKVLNPEVSSGGGASYVEPPPYSGLHMVDHPGVGVSSGGGASYVEPPPYSGLHMVDHPGVEVPSGGGASYPSNQEKGDPYASPSAPRY